MTADVHAYVRMYTPVYIYATQLLCRMERLLLACQLSTKPNSLVPLVIQVSLAPVSCKHLFPSEGHLGHTHTHTHPRFHFLTTGPKIDLNPGVLLLEDMSHPWV